MTFSKKLISILIIGICLFLLNGSSLTSYASSINTNNSSIIGSWQIIIDGESGEGSPFYRLNFQDNQTIIITKQSGGQNITESKSWQIDNNIIQITSNLNDEIVEFDKANLIIKNNKTINFKLNSFEGTINKHNGPLSIFHWVMILVVLIALNELFRRSKWSSIIFYFVLPIVLIPLWANQGVTYWFKWVKVYSVVFACIWFILFRFTKLGQFNFAKLVAALFLAINIAEAVTQDFSMGYLPNTLNAIAGIFSILTLFYGWKDIHADDSKEKDLVWPKMTVLWIISYDIWNWVFVYLNFPGSASAQFMVLLSCTIPSLFIKKGTWLQARAFTLAAWFMYYFSFPRFTETMELLVPRNYNLMLIAALISIVANVIYGIIYVRMLYTEKRLVK